MKISKKSLGVGILIAIFIVLIAILTNQIQKAGEISESALIKPKAITFDHSVDKNILNQMVLAARLYYTFWDTGEFKYLDAVISPTFTDHTAAMGDQGPQGLKLTSNQLRSAIPDLRCSVEDLLIAGEMTTARINCRGVSKYQYRGHAATGKQVEFGMIDILRIQDGKVIDAWREEDKLSLYQQLNIITVPLLK